MADNQELENLVSLCKRRGFIYPGSEIYGGLAGTWDYGPLGVALKNNIKNLWWKKFVLKRDDVWGLDAAILMNAKAWEASGHATGFNDPLVECKRCKRRFREDQTKGKCSECGGELTAPRSFNMMFKTYVGASEDGSAASYLRPETAQGIFVNFKNIIDSFHPKLPFGVAQIGKAFRNEIAPRDFIFRVREFEQMEIEYFIRPPKKEADWQEVFEHWLMEVHAFLAEAGAGEVSDREVPEKGRAHYSRRTVDIDYEYPFGKEELVGVAYRTDFDLRAHGLDFYDEETKEKFVPHVVEPSFGVDRLVLAILNEAYNEDEMNGERRTVLRFKPALAPVKVAVFPLLKNKPDLVKKAREIYESVKKDIQPIMFDDNGNIGKRYRRQDEIGTPWCVTIDFDTLKDNTITVRDRDTGKQERVGINKIAEYIKERLE